MLDFLNELDDREVANEIIEKVAVVSHKKLITKDLVSENIDKIKPILFELEDDKKKLVDKYFVNKGQILSPVSPNSDKFGDVSISAEVKMEMSVEEVEREKEMGEIKKTKKDEDIVKVGSVKILSSPVIACQKLEVRDFVKYFRSRYNFMKCLLQSRPELDSLVSIDKISGNRDFSIIGIVTSKQITKNKNLILEVEDLTGKVKVLINQNKEEIFEKGKEILLDDVIGFKCNGSREFLFVNDLFYPDCFLKEKKRTEEEVYALFISDLHIGSGNFLEKNLNKFVNWLNGKDCDEKQKEVLKKIKYMFVVGDSIDGVGIYPGQEKDLKIKDIKKQYEKLAEFYKEVPKYISIIQCAGQHDGVRVAEPQPPIGCDFGECLHEIENLYLVSNPSMVEIEGGGDENGGSGKEGFKVLMYHGASMHGIINEIEELRMANAHSTPSKVVKHMLLRRHLAPTHGATTYIPDANEDSMLIKEVPDIITTGDLHRTDIDSYNNVLIIGNSCWQSMTAFEEKVGNQPDPCKVPIFNLKTREIRILDFSDVDDRGEVECEVESVECKAIEKERDSEEGSKEWGDESEVGLEVSKLNEKEVVC